MAEVVSTVKSTRGGGGGGHRSAMGLVLKCVFKKCPENCCHALVICCDRPSLAQRRRTGFCCRVKEQSYGRLALVTAVVACCSCDGSAVPAPPPETNASTPSFYTYQSWRSDEAIPRCQACPGPSNSLRSCWPVGPTAFLQWACSSSTSWQSRLFHSNAV